MTILRQFIIAPSLARLIQKERTGERVLEGYFPDQLQRRTYVQVKETRSSLILEAREGAAAVIFPRLRGHRVSPLSARPVLG
jgi:hypothetical protein